MNNVRGVTLIELMVTVAIIVILAAVAYPAYTGYTTKARRSDAKTVLGEAAQWMQRYYSNNFRYTDVPGAGGVIATLPADLQTSPKGSANSFYTITGALVGGDQQTFMLRATPTGSQTGDGVLTIDNQGNKAWDKNNDGSFDANEQCWEKNCG